MEWEFEAEALREMLNGPGLSAVERQRIQQELERIERILESYDWSGAWDSGNSQSELPAEETTETEQDTRWWQVSFTQLENFFKQTGHFMADSITHDLLMDLNRTLRKYEVNTPERIAMFMATVAHESKTGLVEAGVGTTYVRACSKSP